MKKLIFFLLLFFYGDAFGAGTVTSEMVDAGPSNDTSRIKTIVFTCTADAAAATYPATAFSAAQIAYVKGYFLSHLKADPGATGPTDNSDVTLTYGGFDILGGNGTDIIDETVNGVCVPYGSNGDAQYPMTGEALTLNISNNAVNSAVTVITLVFER